MKENEQNFDELKKLLRLKRHETPPPGFFNHFSDKVTARIRAGEIADRGSAFERLQIHSPWLAKFISAFEAKSSVFGMGAAAACLLVMVGVVMNDKSDKASAPNFLANSETAAAPEAVLASITAPAPLLATGDGGIQISTNPAASLQPVASLFGQPNSMLQSASFAPAQ
jgi:hypothetical protein